MSRYVSKPLHTMLSGLFLPGPGRLISVSSLQIMEKWGHVSGVVELSTPLLLNLYFWPLKRSMGPGLGLFGFSLCWSICAPTRKCQSLIFHTEFKAVPSFPMHSGAVISSSRWHRQK